MDLEESVKLKSLLRDTLNSWAGKNGDYTSMYRNYNLVIDGLFFNNSKNKAIVFVIMQRIEDRSGVDYVQMHTCTKSDQSWNFYHVGNASLSYSQETSDGNDSVPLSIDALSSAYRKQLFQSYGILDGCKFNQEFMDIWLDEYDAKKHKKWLSTLK
jgi:hypothetical protein